MKAEPQSREKVSQPAAQGEVQRKTGEIGNQDLMYVTPAQRQVAALAQMAQGSARGAQLRQFAEMAKGAPQVRQLQAVQEMAAQRAPKRNETGLPDDLKSGVEALSGISMDDVRVHYNSSKPAQLNALAYAQGTDIHVGPGQEKHLPHEAWHVVQQAQGRVRATGQMKGVEINDCSGLEKEADVMGGKAVQLVGRQKARPDLMMSTLWQAHYHSNNNNAAIQLAPDPMAGLPDTCGLYNAQNNAKAQVWDGSKPKFGLSLYAARVREFQGGKEKPSWRKRQMARRR